MMKILIMIILELLSINLKIFKKNLTNFKMEKIKFNKKQV